ncbi:hypothetical protein JOC54_004689 [Alkalihalobacillus xiaoxiensis]|uniref:Uncharacterized protein n=1 Tax=Shouchella xiaoxiensis TaxID=766895 RepID=A0ABS2T1K2_9BACI|nr:SE1561 family protein [Shouchella xiaoxiensis]MBM7841385.1 hypothetical protein [Shouchella xiaoxiensis]
MGGTINSKDKQLDYLQQRFVLLAEVVEGMDADSATVNELDSILTMIEDIETKCIQFRKDWPSE